MEYISAEEFLKQPKEVQKMFLEWWKPSVGDLIGIRTKVIDMEWNTITKYKVKCVTEDDIFNYDSKEELLDSFKITGDPRYSDETVLLPGEGQLRKFIEDKIGCIINVSYKHKPQDGYMKLDFDFYEYPGDDKYMIYISTKYVIATSILEAYWKVACQIAKEVIDNE